MFSDLQLLKIVPAANLFLAGFIFLSLIWVHIISKQEHESTAAKRSLVAALVVPVPWLLVGLLPIPILVGLVWILLSILGPLLLVIPTGKPRKFSNETPTNRIDERTIMFSRNALKPGSDNFNNYYADHPEHRKNDDHFRSLAGLLSPRSGKFEPLAFAAAEASFQSVAELSALVEGEPKCLRIIS